MRNVTIGLLILNLLFAVLCAFTLSPIGIFNAVVAGGLISLVVGLVGAGIK